MIYNLTDTKYEIILDYSVKDNLKSFKEEVLDELYRVHQQQGEMPILYSGGMDGTFILRSLQELGVKIKTLSFSFTKDNSDHECLLVKERCRRYGIKTPEFFYFDKDDFISYAEYINQNKNIYYPSMHGFLMDYCVNNSPYNSFYCGMSCEYKLIQGKIVMPALPFIFKKNNPNKTFGFTNDKTFLSYFKHPLFMSNYKNDNPLLDDGMEDKWYVRDLIYMDCYPDIKRSLKNISAIWPSRDHITSVFSTKICNHNFIKPASMVFDPEFLVNV